MSFSYSSVCFTSFPAQANQMFRALTDLHIRMISNRQFVFSDMHPSKGHSTALTLDAASGVILRYKGSTGFDAVNERRHVCVCIRGVDAVVCLCGEMSRILRRRRVAARRTVVSTTELATLSWPRLRSCSNRSSMGPIVRLSDSPTGSHRRRRRYG